MYYRMLLLILLVPAILLGATVELNTFNAGEMSPLMNSRADFPKYRAGAKTLENMLVKSQGPVSRRPGTKYIASVKNAEDPTRLLSFEFSTEDTYIIEASDQYFRFYRDSGQIQDGGGALEIVSPYDSNDIFEVQLVQDAEVMRMVHGDVPPYKLTRTSHTAWTMTEIAFTTGPFLAENDDTTLTITPSARTGSITLTASSALFNVSGHVGALWQISHITDANQTTGRMDEVGDLVGPVTVEKGREFTWITSGHWSGTIILERSEDDGSSYTTVGPPATYNFDGNIQFTGIESEADSIYRLRMTVYNAGDDNVTFPTLTALSFIRRAAVDITAVASTTSATATVIDTLDSTDATYRHAEGAWSTFRGFPRTIEHHEQRVIYGGTSSFPQHIWASITALKDADFDDFSVDFPIAENDAWTYILPGMNPIQWMQSQELLMIGTTSSIGLLGQPNKPITAVFSPIYRTQAKNGSAYIQAVTAVDAVLFVERGNEKIREARYTFSSDRYVAPDMTVLAEHILRDGNGVKEIAFQDRPEPILWCVRNDGQLASFTYNRKHDVLAFSRNDTGASGLFESVASIPGSNEDEVWVVAGRTVDSNSVRYVEQFQPQNWGSDANDMYFVDSGVDDPNNLSHLEGETVALFADAIPRGTFTVSSGAITPGASYTNYTIGLPYTSVLETMPLVALQRFGSSYGRQTQILSLTMDVQDTLGMHVGPNAALAADQTKFSDDNFATIAAPYTGIWPRRGSMPASYWGTTRTPVVYIYESDPLPFTIRGIYADVEVTIE